MYFLCDLFEAFRDLEPVTEGLHTQNSSMSQKTVNIIQNTVKENEIIQNNAYQQTTSATNYDR